MILKSDIIKMIHDMADVIIENEVLFCEFDSVAGDGDFGMSISKGFKQLLSGWSALNHETIGTFLGDCSEVISEYCGGASGPIWGSAFRGASKYTADKVELNAHEFAEMMENAALAIQKRGKAQRGDKTLLDALLPCVDALKESAEAQLSIDQCLENGAKAAVEGAELTKSMVASKGRASYVGERSLEHPDAGAMALGIIFTHLSNGFKNR